MSDNFISIDEEVYEMPINQRERLCIKLVLLVIGMVYPSKYEHQINKFIDSIKEDLKGASER